MAFEWFMIVMGWLSLGAFLAVATYKITRVTAQPLNVRWEVYPVPHESKARREYGGSYMEEVDWAAKATHPSRLPGLLEIAKEVVYLKRVREFNQYGLWGISLAMHWGLYLGLATIGLAVIETLLGVTFGLTPLVAGVAFTLGAVGSLAIIAKRLTNAELGLYTVPADLFNLGWVAALFILGIIGGLMDTTFAGYRAYVASVLTFKPVPVPPIVLIHFLVLELFFIYMPFTKIIHYIGKYFTFEQTLWDDAFKTKGSAADNKVLQQLGYPVTWNAPHIVPGKTWLEQAQATGLEEGAQK
ncbi:MAG: respiratory nitrate reductase subunit gamma [Chloroflexi bacterium]|nr:respiratory nitrate reductase subunit gamma [Chloroflexota bacterium]